MTSSNRDITEFTKNYLSRLNSCFNDNCIGKINKLTEDLLSCWIEKRQVFICGNGGSAANALHMANDFHYGIGACGMGQKISGLRVEALSGNAAIMSCLANDTGYENIYSNQIKTKANKNDLLIVLSGSGNSPNVVNALLSAKKLGVKSYAIVAFSGGRCKEIANETIHFQINDMQIAEDTQLIVGHICMQILSSKKQLVSEKSKHA